MAFAKLSYTYRVEHYVVRPCTDTQCQYVAGAPALCLCLSLSLSLSVSVCVCVCVFSFNWRLSAPEAARPMIFRLLLRLTSWVASAGAYS